MKHYFPDVPGLGNVAVSRHAQDQREVHGITEYDFEQVLLEPTQDDVHESGGILWRERDGIRLVIIERPEPFRGAKLVKTVYRVLPQKYVR